MSKVKHRDFHVWSEQARFVKPPEHAYTCPCGTTWRAYSDAALQSLVAAHQPNCKEKTA